VQTASHSHTVRYRITASYKNIARYRNTANYKVTASCRVTMSDICIKSESSGGQWGSIAEPGQYNCVFSSTPESILKTVDWVWEFGRSMRVDRRVRTIWSHLFEYTRECIEDYEDISLTFLLRFACALFALSCSLVCFCAQGTSTCLWWGGMWWGGPHPWHGMMAWNSMARWREAN
jgi:hypothetical protein